MKTKTILGFVLGLFLILSCEQLDYENDDLHMFDMQIENTNNSKVTAENETYYFNYGFEYIGNIWIDDTFLKIGFNDISNDINGLNINGVSISNIHSNMILIQVKSNHPSSYKHNFKKILFVNDISLISDSELEKIEHQNKIKVIDGNTGWILWNPDNHDLITITTEQPIAVGWKKSNSVSKVTIQEHDYVAINFLLTDTEKILDSNEEWIIKENGLFQ